MNMSNLAGPALITIVCGCQSSAHGTLPHAEHSSGLASVGADASDSREPATLRDGTESNSGHHLAEYSPDLLARMSLQDSAGAKAGGPVDKEAELAQKLSNPVAALISVPIQTNWDTGIGPANADRTTINIQPVIPFSFGQDWNLITRTIIPIIDAESPVNGGTDESGLGDIAESIFLSPKKPTESGWIWGAGPVLLFPTASNDAVGSEKWAAGPTVVMLKQQSGWTYGALANHLWSYAGADDRRGINATFFQPFVSFTTKANTTLALNTESVYDWDKTQWTVPINLSISQLVKIGGLPMSFGVAYREYVESPSGGPDWGLRFSVAFLFPK